MTPKGWTEVDWIALKQKKLSESDPAKVVEAVAFLRERLKNIMPELRERIAEDPIRWIGGTRKVPCACTRMPVPSGEKCPVCHNTREISELSLHHGWGTCIRNMLRENGMGEEYFGVLLDDIYVQLVELAAK